MKILHIPTGGLISDGIVSCIVDYMAAMNKSDMDIRVLATNIGEKKAAQRVKDSGCKVISLPYRKTNIIKYFFTLYRYIAKEKIDIVHVHGSSAIMSVEILAAKLAGCKIRIAHSHNTTCNHKKADSMLRPIFNWLYTDAFACGKDAGKWLFGERKFTVIPNGRNIEEYVYNTEKRIQYRKELKIPESAFVIGHVGRFNIQKNHEYIIRIFEEIYKKNKNSYLVLIGTGERIDEIKEVVNKSDIRAHVIFAGVIDKVSGYLSAFDAMLLPSLYEGFPMVVIEWQISGLPCLISDKVTTECALTSLVKFKSLEENPKSWAIDIEQLVRKDREKDIKAICGEIKDAGYDIKTDAEKLKEIYVSLLEKV